MKKITLLLFLSFGFIHAQDKLITKTGKITFEASVPAFEEVKAVNESSSCVLNTATGEIASLSLMKGYKFKIALMEEHFNENYIESDKYPKAVFRGKIENFDISALSKTAKDFKITGVLELHGKSKQITVPAKIKKNDNKVEIAANFNVNADDFDIKIPSIVSKKVSKKVNVSIDFKLM